MYVDCFSNGKVLNSTLWLQNSFDEHIYDKVPKFLPTYGILIDADNDLSSGLGGFDFIIRITFDNNTKTSTSTLEQINDQGIRILERKDNYTGFPHKLHLKYIRLN